MEENELNTTESQEKQKNKSGGNTLLIVIISCWLLFYLYTGSQTGAG